VVQQAALGHTGLFGNGIQCGSALPDVNEEFFKGVKDGITRYGFSGHGSNHASWELSFLNYTVQTV
jgi:hypothetical protein